MVSKQGFWEQRTLADMSRDEWESLCDGCGYCCLVKLEDEDNGNIYTTNIACRLLDTSTCDCQDYKNRQIKVSTCLILTIDKPEQFDLLPETCAYRCLHESRPLPAWHPLLSQDAGSVKKAGISVCDYAISEEYIHPEQIQDHIIHQLK